LYTFPGGAPKINEQMASRASCGSGVVVVAAAAAVRRGRGGGGGGGKR